jgi:hypothetical protein
MLFANQDHIKTLNDNGLNLSLFSCKGMVNLDLLQTLSIHCAPMKAYEAIMQWTIRSRNIGHVFHNTAITTQEAVMPRLTKCINRDWVMPMIWEIRNLLNTDVTVKVDCFSASAVFADLLFCRHLDVDTNDIFDGDFNPNHDPNALSSHGVLGDSNTVDQISKLTAVYARTQIT